MSNITFTNFAATTLNTGINSSVTSLVVSSGTGALFPSLAGAQYFYCTLVDAATGTTREIVKVTARSTDTFTIVRGQESTTSSSYLAGDKVELRLTAAGINTFATTETAQTFVGNQTISGTLSATGITTVAAGSAALPAIVSTTGTADTGLWFPAADTIAASTAGTERLRIDSSGNLGLGVTPSAWQANNRALQIYEGWACISGNNSQGCCDVSSNAYNSTAQAILGWKYINSSSLASLYQQSAGVHKWLTAPSGTAGDGITFTQAMTLDASGKLGIGTTTATRRLQVGNGSGDIKTAIGQSLICLAANSGNVGYVNEIGFGGNNETNVQCAIGSIVTSATASGFADLYFATRSVTTDTAPTERMRLDSSGTLGLKVTPSGSSAGALTQLQIGGSGGLSTFYGQSNDYACGVLSAAYFNSSSQYVYAATSKAVSEIYLYNGDIIFRNAAAGTAGNTFTPTERARIDTSGKLLVGTTSAFSGSGISPKVTISNTAGVGLIAIGNTDAGIVTQPAANTNYYPAFFLNSSSSGIGNISCTSSATAYNTSSDYRLKENVQPLTGALAKVSALKPVTFKWKADGSDAEGFIAHELAEVCPDAVTGEKDATAMQTYEISPAIPATQDEEGNELTAAVEAVMGEREVPRYQGIDTSFLVATLTAAIQEQQAIITALTTRITALEAK